MKLSVWFDHAKQAPLLESFAQSKADDAFSRYQHRLSSCELRLRREDGSSGPQTHCSLDLKSYSNGVIHVTESDENSQAAILKAIRVAQSKLKRLSERRKNEGRSRGRTAKRFTQEMVLDAALN